MKYLGNGKNLYKTKMFFSVITKEILTRISAS